MRIPLTTQGTPIASRLYALAARPEVSEYRPAAYYAGATSVVGIVFMLALRFRRESKVFAKV